MYGSFVSLLQEYQKKSIPHEVNIVSYYIVVYVILKSLKVLFTWIHHHKIA